MVLDIQTVHHILKKYSSSKCKQTVCLHTDLTSTLSFRCLYTVRKIFIEHHIYTILKYYVDDKYSKSMNQHN